MRRGHAGMDPERYGTRAGGDDLLATADLADQRQRRVVDRTACPACAGDVSTRYCLERMTCCFRSSP